MSPRSRSLLQSSKKQQLLGMITCGCFIYLYSNFNSTTFSVSPFNLISLVPLPVHHDSQLIYYENHPVSIHRPLPNQFSLNSRHYHKLSTTSTPTVLLITAANNPRLVLLDTAKSILHQSLTNFEWLIIDDHSLKEDSLKLLTIIAKDPRVTIIKNKGKSGLPASRNLGLDYALSKNVIPTYLVCIDDDDLFELTALEKVVWMLESNEEWAIGGFPFVKFAAQNITETRGLHNGRENYAVGNFVPNAAIFRSSAVISSNCRYDEVNFEGGGEDWDIWMCFAEAGMWGGTLPELLYWYRVNPTTFRNARWGNTFVDGFSALQAKVQSKHGSLSKHGAFPVKAPRWSSQLESISWKMPYSNSLDIRGKAIMFVIPWLYVGGADVGALHMIQLFVEAGYRVTVVCTLFKNPQGIELRPFVLMWTHDLHILPAFLRARDMPRYLKHLIESRGIEEVIMSNSQLMYELLPALSEQLPHVRFIDYLHNEAYDGWKSGGYPTYSIISQRYLARTITCSSYLRHWAIERGHVADRIGVVKLGIEMNTFTPADGSARQRAKRDLLGISPETIVITIVARLDPQKRSVMIPDIADSLRRLGAKDFIIVMVGNGESSAELKEKIKLFRVEGIVRIMGTVTRPQDFLAATDIFLLPSVSEGISIAVAEAMAMALPIVTARAGALPEQLGETLVTAVPPPILAPFFSFGNKKPDPPSSLTLQARSIYAANHDDYPTIAGVLVNHTLDDSVDAKLYAEALYKLVLDPELRHQYGVIGRDLVERTSDWRTTLKGLFNELRLAREAGKNEATQLNPAAHFAIQNLLLEQKAETDFAAFQSTLKLPPRFGLGLELQQRCGESEAGMTEWLNAITEPKTCPGAMTPVASYKHLAKSARFQCAAWCIYDLTTPEYEGWSFNGNCFIDITEADWCKDHFVHRPTVQLSALED